MTRPGKEDPRDLAEAALPPDEIPQYPPTELPDVDRSNETPDEVPATDTPGDREHTKPGESFSGFAR